jgi:hypothetical protein
MNRYTLLFLLTLSRGFSGYCQDTVSTGYGHVLPEEFHPISPVIDSNVDVVVLSDVGHAELVGIPFFGWRVQYTRCRRLLIRNQKGVGAAKIKISFDPDKNGTGKLWNLHANTYNLKAGEVVKVPVDTTDMYLNKENDGNVTESFSFPDVGPGSIIEYTYSIASGSMTRFHSWDFQGDYPRLKSEFTATIPATFNYAVSRQGALPMTRTVDSSTKKIGVGSYWVQTLVYNIHWGMKDVPALQSEPYVATMDDHVAGVRFQLSAYTELDTRRRKTFLNSWKDLNDRFYKDKTFGGIMTASTHFLRRELREIVQDSLSDIDKAKTLYTYVRDNFTSKGSEMLSDEDRTIKEVFKSKRGSLSEINLLLTAMLRDEGLKADAVILSTRGNGVINPYYPLTENLNYVIVRLRAGGRAYFLDATDPHLGFGKIPLECYNGYARVVSEQPDSAMLVPDSLTEFKFGTMFLSSNDAGDGLVGTFKETQGYYTSLEIRNSVSKRGQDAYFEELRSAYPFEVQLREKQIDSLKAYDEPVTVHYGVAISMAGEDRLYFNPMLSEGKKENPFAASVRHYPIEMPYKIEELFVLQMDIPKGYEVEDLPKGVRIKLNESDGSYEYGFLSDGESIQLRSRLVLSRTYFAPEEYQNLRDFYALVVKKQSEVVVFRKKKEN